MFRDSSFEFSGEKKSRIYSKRPGRPLQAKKTTWGGLRVSSPVRFMLILEGKREMTRKHLAGYNFNRIHEQGESGQGKGKWTRQQSKFHSIGILYIFLSKTFTNLHNIPTTSQ